MNIMGSDREERGQILGNGALIVAVLSVLAWPPLNLYASGLSIIVAVLAILHGERKYALITPLVVGVGLFILSPVTMAIIWAASQDGHPEFLFMIGMFLLVPFAAVRFDNARNAAPSIGKQAVGMFDFLQAAGERQLNANPAKQRDQQQAMVLTPVLGGLPYQASLKSLRQGRELTIGRDPSCDLVLTDKSVSREHARIGILNGQGIGIRDLGSANGTFVDGRPVGREFAALVGVRRIRLGACEVSINLTHSDV